MDLLFREMKIMRSAQLSIAVDVVHECAIIRTGLVGMLARLPGTSLSQGASSANEYMCLHPELRALVALVSPKAALELGMNSHEPGSKGIGGVRLIIIASGFGDLDARAALHHGAMGLLLLTVEPDELLIATRRVFLGDHYVTSPVAARIAAQLYAESLTMREQQILEFLSEGRCNKSIANELRIAVGTVKTHVKAILSKLDVSSRTEAVVVASRRGIVHREAGMPEPLPSTDIDATRASMLESMYSR